MNARDKAATIKRDDREEAEQAAIRALRTLARKWPNSLWLFAAGGSLTVMRTKEDGTRAHLPPPDGGYDPAYRIESVDISCDGGDW